MFLVFGCVGDILKFFFEMLMFSRCSQDFRHSLYKPPARKQSLTVYSAQSGFVEQINFLVDVKNRFVCFDMLSPSTFIYFSRPAGAARCARASPYGRDMTRERPLVGAPQGIEIAPAREFHRLKAPNNAPASIL